MNGKLRRNSLHSGLMTIAASNSLSVILYLMSFTRMFLSTKVIDFVGFQEAYMQEPSEESLEGRNRE